MMRLFTGVIAETEAPYSGRVRVLSPEVAHRIAAGEVTEQGSATRHGTKVVVSCD
jgi:hypothetical protein